MKRIKSSIVAWSLGGSLLLFAGLYYTMPYERFLDFALALAFGVTFATVIRYMPDAFRAARSGKAGAEFLIVAVFSIAVVLLGQRVWGLALRIMDRPDWLVNSPISVLIPWMLSWSVSLALVAPDIDQKPDEAGSSLWRSIALFIGGALAGFAVAASFGARGSLELTQSIEWPQLLNRAQCPSNKPVWGSSSKIYHVENSPYRSMVIPSHCFSTTVEAEQNGFRAPKGMRGE